MIDPKKNGNRTLRVRYDSGAIFVGPAIITDEGDTLVLLGGASSLLVRRADGSLPLHVAAVETPPEDDGPCLDAALAVFDDHANCLACYGVNVGGELGDDWDKAKAGWHDHVRDQRRQAMLDELADVLQTVGNLITAFGITDEEVERAMDDCLERNRRKGRL